MWYNNTIVRAELQEINIEYMDGTTATLKGDDLKYVQYKWRLQGGKQHLPRIAPRLLLRPVHHIVQRLQHKRTVFYLISPVTQITQNAACG